MKQTNGIAAPGSGPNVSQAEDIQDALPTFTDLMQDNQIMALTTFEPVPRKVKRGNSWTPQTQRKFIAYVAHLGSRSKAAAAVGREVAGASKLCASQGGGAFRDACDAALDLYQQRKDAEAVAQRGGSWAEPLRSRQRRAGRAEAADHEGEVRNEFGEWEDEHSHRRRGEDAIDSIRNKLLRCRRLFLQEISTSPGKRAAFEILTELPVDWDKAAALKEQEFEPWHKTNQRQPDMVLAAESGWTFGEFGYGEDKKAALRAAIDEHRAQEGLDPVDWSENAERSEAE